MIRQAQSEDAAAVASVVREVYEEHGFPWDPEGSCSDLLDLSRYLGHFWVAEIEGEIVACGGLTLHDASPGNLGEIIEVDGTLCVAGTEAELHRLYVRPAYRRQGLARSIMEAIRDFCIQRNIRHVEIWSDVVLADAHIFYSNLGAKQVGRRQVVAPLETYDEYCFLWSIK